MEENKPIDKPKKEKKKDKTAKSAGTMFRNTMSNHLQLSALADRKAGLLVSINAIIISITTSFLVHDFTSNQRLILPTCLLVVVCLITITFALMATRPNVTPLSKGSPSDNKNTPAKSKADIDLLFFGDYTQLSVDEYKEAMKELIKNEPHMHDKMIENTYAQGKVIMKKYSLLKKAYTFFMVGFPVAIISYLIALMWGQAVIIR